MRTVTFQNENTGDSYSFSGISLHPKQEALEKETRHIACLIQESCNSLNSALYLFQKGEEDPPESAREMVHRKQMLEDSIKASAVEICSALDGAKVKPGKPDTYRGNVFKEFCKNQENEIAWEQVREWRNKAVAHKINISVHDWKGYSQGSLFSAHTNDVYASGLNEALLKYLNITISELKRCIMTVYLRSKEELELQGFRGFRGTDKKTGESLWNDLSLGRNLNTKVQRAQKSIEIDACNLIEALKSGKGVISAWETTCLDVLNPVRKAWIELSNKIRHAPERYKMCNDFVRLVDHQFESELPTQQEVEAGIMNGFGGLYGNDNRNDLIAITEKLFRL